MTSWCLVLVIILFVFAFFKGFSVSKWCTSYLGVWRMGSLGYHIHSSFLLVVVDNFFYYCYCFYCSDVYLEHISAVAFPMIYDVDVLQHHHVIILPDPSCVSMFTVIILYTRHATGPREAVKGHNPHREHSWYHRARCTQVQEG